MSGDIAALRQPVAAILDAIADAEARYCLGEAAGFDPGKIYARWPGIVELDTVVGLRSSAARDADTRPFIGFIVDALLAAQDYEAQTATVRAAGFADLIDYADRIGCHNVEALAAEAAEFLDHTRPRYDSIRQAAFAEGTFGVAQLIRAVRSTFADPVDLTTCLPLLHDTVTALDVELTPRVRLDVGGRPGKVSGAYCLPIRIPEHVVVAVSGVGGVGDCRPLFHEAGHGLHFSHTAADLPVEARRLGDTGLVEGWGVLTENLFLNEAWLHRSFPAGTANELARDTARRLLIVMRAQCVRLLFATHAVRQPADAAELHRRHERLVAEHLGAQATATEYLDVLAGRFISSTRLRSWRFGWALGSLLSTEFGPDWPARPRAGAWLMEHWAEGVSYDAVTAARQWGAPEPSLRHVAEDLLRVLA